MRMQSALPSEGPAWFAPPRRLDESMKLTLLDAQGLVRTLKRLIERHDTIALAVAWGDYTGVAKVLVANKRKFRSVLLGVDYSASDPDLIDALAGTKNAYVTRKLSGCFHPKLYYFESGADAEAIVGSANFTRGGLGPNREACVHIVGRTNDVILKDISDLIESYADQRQPITKEVATSYRRQAEIAAQRPRARHPILPDGRKKDWQRMHSELATMDWATFARRARENSHHDYSESIRMLRKVQSMIAEAGRFDNLDRAQWKAVAGTIGEREKVTGGLDGYGWGWFGSMAGMGVFANLIGNQSREIAEAMDSLPARGDVTEQDYHAFLQSFTRAFHGSSRTGGVPTATRLLAMKRPDCFVCVDGPNRAGLAEALAFAPNTLKLDNYWQRVIEPIRLSPWYNARRPGGEDGELWDYRAAMLDAIYYDP